MKLKILTPVLINNQYIMEGVHEIDKVNADYIVNRGWARPVAKDEDPAQVDFIEDIPSRLIDEFDDGALKGQIVDPMNADVISDVKKKKKKNK